MTLSVRWFGKSLNLTFGMFTYPVNKKINRPKKMVRYRYLIMSLVNLMVWFFIRSKSLFLKGDSLIGPWLRWPGRIKIHSKNEKLRAATIDHGTIFTNFPVVPARRNIGKKAIRVVTKVVIIGTITFFSASLTASWGDLFFMSSWLIASETIMASSTIIPKIKII